MTIFRVIFVLYLIKLSEKGFAQGTNVDTVLKQNQLKKTAQLLTFTIMYWQQFCAKNVSFCMCGFFSQRNCVAS